MKRAAKKLMIVVFGVVIPLFSSPAGLFRPPAVFPQDPLAGSRVFGAKGCSGCHAVNGVGGKSAPDLGRVPGARSFYDLATAMWNHIPEMSAQLRKKGRTPPQLSPREAGDLIAFLAAVDYFDPAGDPGVGKRVFAEKRCVVCHQIERVGGVFGPSLDSVVQFGPIFFAATMWNHGPAMAEAMRSRGITRPVFTGRELRDLAAYIKSVSRARGDQPIRVLPGTAAEGERLFAARGCVDCHGIKGTGGPVGPPLAGQNRYASLFDFAAAMWNKGPVMEREMKRRSVAVPALQANELADIVGFLYSVDYFAGRGDPRRGEEVISAKGCLLCHSVRGKGARTAPDFARIRGLEQPANVVSAMWNHGAAMAQKTREQQLAWPILKGDEMAQIVAFLASVGSGRR
ncbi:MAG TPA: c-type cytochrome [candidate division Zixibacteria bacterium]|nr:c-type cytochrome [candidate division Zixibacteria bacterium]